MSGSATLGWSLARLAAACGGRVVGDDPGAIDSITTDSRAVPARSCFVALRGERFDGHRFAAAARAAGAVAVVVAAGSGVDVTPRVEVADTGAALRDMAAARRDDLAAAVVAVTGSTGKTSTKDLAAAVLPGSFASPRSYNNEIGVPLTVLAAPPGSEHLVLEVGSRGVGHIAWLAPVIRPQVAVVTNLGVVHLETFGTTDRLADAKFELVDQLDESGVAVLPDDEPRLRRPHAGSEITFGMGRGDVAVFDLRLDDLGRPTFRLETPAGEAAIRLQLAGGHQALNAAAAAAAAVARGVATEAIAAGLEAARGSAWRMDVHTGWFTVVNDAYNANPQSVESALRTVAAMPGRHLAVLGEMAELGPVTEAEHRRIGALARSLGFASLITVGVDHGMADAAGEIAVTVPDSDEALAAVKGTVGPGDVVLVKASRAVGLEGLAADLAAEAAT